LESNATDGDGFLAVLTDICTLLGDILNDSAEYVLSGGLDQVLDFLWDFSLLLIDFSRKRLQSVTYYVLHPLSPVMTFWVQPLRICTRTGICVQLQVSRMIDRYLHRGLCSWLLKSKENGPTNIHHFQWSDKDSAEAVLERLVVLMAKDYDAIREDMVDWAIIAGCLILYGCVTSYRRFRIFWRLGRSEDAEVRAYLMLIEFCYGISVRAMVILRVVHWRVLVFFYRILQYTNH